MQEGDPYQSLKDSEVIRAERRRFLLLKRETEGRRATFFGDKSYFGEVVREAVKGPDKRNSKGKVAGENAKKDRRLTDSRVKEWKTSKAGDG